MSKFIRVSKDKPCPICQAKDWCGVSEEGTIAICMRVQSELKSKNGGYIHRLTEKRVYVAPTRPKSTVSLFSANLYWSALRPDWDHIWADGLSLSLGVTEDSINALEPIYDPFNQAFGFPMRDGDGNVVGIRLRNVKGDKWAVKGSKEGLFYATDIHGPDIAVCEGPTDTASAMSIGLQAVGRPSCKGCVEHLKTLLTRIRARRVTIIADNDAPKRLPDGSWWRPGNNGAEELGKLLKREYRVVYPAKGKDIRSWVSQMEHISEFDNQASVSKFIFPQFST
jgi:hypothetical protein